MDEIDEDDEEDDFDDSSKSQSEMSGESAKAENLWSPRAPSRPSSEQFVTSRSHRPATVRSLDEGPLSPAPPPSRESFHGRLSPAQVETPSTSLTSGAVVCGNLSAALRSRTRRARSQDVPTGMSSGDFATKKAASTPRRGLTFEGGDIALHTIARGILPQ